MTAKKEISTAAVDSRNGPHRVGAVRIGIRGDDDPKTPPLLSILGSSPGCDFCESPYPNIACDKCRPEWIISLAEANKLVNEVTETRARMADIRDKLTDLRKALNRRPGSLLEKQIADSAIILASSTQPLQPDAE